MGGTTSPGGKNSRVPAGYPAHNTQMKEGKEMLNWKTLDPEAVYPNWQFEANGEKYRFRATPQHDGWWHLLITQDDAYVISLNCRGLDRAKDTAQNFEVFEAETVGGAR